MEIEDVVQFFADHYRQAGDTLWRLETLPEYSVADDGPNFQLWLDGATGPDPQHKGEWLDMLRREHAEGLREGRTRIMGDARTGHLTDYERYACEFGYAYNVPAGQDVRVIRRGEHDIPAGIAERDFWLVNDAHVVLMDYDEHGRFIGADLVEGSDAQPYIKTRILLRDAGEPFAPWWNRHGELHRRMAA